MAKGRLFSIVLTTAELNELAISSTSPPSHSIRSFASLMDGAVRVLMSFLNLAVATIFIAWVKWGCISYSLQCQTLAIQSLVIFCMFLMALIRIESVFSVAAPLACWPRAALEGSSAALRALHVGKRKAAALPPVAPRRGATGPASLPVSA